MMLTSVTKQGAENPKARSDEANRDTEHLLHQELTTYDRYIKYGKLPRKKNARKRLGRHIEKNAERIHNGRQLKKEHLLRL